MGGAEIPEDVADDIEGQRQNVEDEYWRCSFLRLHEQSQEDLCRAAPCLEGELSKEPSQESKAVWKNRLKEQS
jgi:hypothetical protein